MFYLLNDDEKYKFITTIYQNIIVNQSTEYYLYIYLYEKILFYTYSNNLTNNLTFLIISGLTFLFQTNDIKSPTIAIAYIDIAFTYIAIKYTYITIAVAYNGITVAWYIAIAFTV